MGICENVAKSVTAQHFKGAQWNNQGLSYLDVILNKYILKVIDINHQYNLRANIGPLYLLEYSIIKLFGIYRQFRLQLT